MAVRSWLYHPKRSPTEIAAFAPLVERAALDGCPTSRAILGNAGTELAAMINSVAGQLSHALPLPVAIVGSVVRQNRLIRSAFKTSLEKACGISGIQEPNYSPELGAALLAIQASRFPLSPRLFQRLNAELTVAFTGTNETQPQWG